MDHSKSSSSAIVFRPSSSNRVRVFTSSFQFDFFSHAFRFRIMHSLWILFFALSCCIGNSSQRANRTENIMKTWGDHAYKWFVSQNCTELNITAESNCLLMKTTEKYNYRIYGTKPIAGQKFGTVFPDGDLKHKIFYDGVIVLDPFPMAKFGHPVLVFHATALSNRTDRNFTVSTSNNQTDNVTAASNQTEYNFTVTTSNNQTDNATALNNQTECDTTKGFLVGDQYCLQLYTRSQCNRTVHKRGVRIRAGSGIGQNCGEIVFLPLVYGQSEPVIQGSDKLRCFSNIEGFNRSCPVLRPEDRSNRVWCHPLVNNNQYCGFYDNRLDSKCSKSQTCDHAVLLSGGWNRQLSDASTWNNIIGVKRLLMTHGFLEDSIAIFYGNGPKYVGKKSSSDDNSDEDDYEDIPEPDKYFSSSLKDVMRNHIRSLCDNDFCADTLFIYLNSPAKPDGSSLLWDFFDDGVYAEDELYSPKELYRDIYRCKAKRVVVLADQNYGSALVTQAEVRFMHLQNVIVLTANEEFNHNGSRDRLTAQLLREKYYDFCLSNFRNIINKSQKSPDYIGYRSNLLNATLVGAPCTAKATSLNDPETMKYRGCSLAPLV